MDGVRVWDEERSYSFFSFFLYIFLKIILRARACVCIPVLCSLITVLIRNQNDPVVLISCLDG